VFGRKKKGGFSPNSPHREKWTGFTGGSK